MKLKKRQIIFILITAAIMVFIFLQSALPADLSQKESNFLVPFISNLFHINADSASFVIRKTAHFLEYTLLGISLGLTTHSLLVYNNRKLVVSGLLAWAIGTVYAVTDEFHQQFVSGRSCELRDMLIDSGGVLLGVLIISLILALNRHRRSTAKNS
ncbi:MAG: VanZ family protein [Parasporobacterium sp.]|nr:VanZ family protein [Parasporobacterium sp.]